MCTESTSPSAGLDSVIPGVLQWIRQLSRAGQRWLVPPIHTIDALRENFNLFVR